MITFCYSPERDIDRLTSQAEKDQIMVEQVGDSDVASHVSTEY